MNDKDVELFFVVQFYMLGHGKIFSKRKKRLLQLIVPTLLNAPRKRNNGK